MMLTCSVGLVLSAPPEQAGLVGAIYQTGLQSSVVIALSIQAGLMTLYPNGIEDMRNVRASWYFELGWTVLWLIGVVTLYRPAKSIRAVDAVEVVHVV
jgi:hypothetical protein